MPSIDPDAARRTRLANERTYLAWWRTGLTSFAVSLGTSKVVPALTDETGWPYVVVGSGFALIGVGFIAAAFYRYRAVNTALDEGRPSRAHPELMLAFAALGVMLGAALLYLSIAEV